MTPNELLDFLHTIGFCGCGQPMEAFKLLRDTLLHFSSAKTDNKWWEKLDKFLESKERPGLVCWWLYWIDYVGLTEHGGSVPGWLTPLGKKVMEAMIAVGKTDKDVGRFLSGEG